MLTMKCLLPKSECDVVYCSEFPREIEREVPEHYLPFPCLLCEGTIESWRVAIGERQLCVKCRKKLRKLRGDSTIQGSAWKPSDLTLLLDAFAQFRNQNKGEPESLIRKCRYAVKVKAAQVGADLLSPVTRQTLADAAEDCVAEYLRRTAGIPKDTKISTWRHVWFAAKRLLASPDKRYIVSQDAADFGALVAKPLLPRGFRPISSYSHSWELLAPLRTELESLRSRFGLSGDFDLLDTAAAIQAAAPELWAGIEYRVLREVES